MGRRKWSKWPQRMSERLNGVSGVAGIGGAALGAGSLTFLAGTAAIAMTGVGTLMLLGAVGYAAIKAVPLPTRSPEDLVGQAISLSDLDNVDPPVPTLAIVGMSQAGKTTLKSRLSFDFSPTTRTQNITAYIVALQTVPHKYIAILDGGGERYAQQFSIAEKCEYLCVVVDHNKSDSITSVNRNRISEHKSFLEQVRHHLDESGPRKKTWVQFLINKRDLWEKSTEVEKARLVQSFTDEAAQFRRGNLASNVDVRGHSNDDADDIAKFMHQLKKAVAS